MNLLNPKRYDDVNQLLQERGIALQEEDRRCVANTFEIISSFVHGKLTTAEIFSAYDLLSDVMKNDRPDIVAYVKKEDRIRVAVRLMEELAETKGKLTEDEKIAFAFCIMTGECTQFCPNMMMLCDPSHICGNREYLHEISQKSADLNYDGLMVESHICPTEAWSDASQQLEPKALGEMIRSINWRSTLSDDPEYLKALSRYREQIDQIDAELFELLSRRMAIADSIGRVKRDNDVVILQSGRWASIVDRVMAQAAKLQLSEEFVRTVLEAIHVESIEHQNRVMNN